MNGNIIAELARVTVEEVYGEEEDFYGFLPTSEMEEAARAAAGYGQDDRALCIGEDTTDDGTPIPEWAFC